MSAAKQFHTAPMKDGIRYDARGEPIQGDAMTAQDGPNTHRYRDAGFVTEWTVLTLDEFTDHGPVTHRFHVPSALLAQASVVDITTGTAPDARQHTATCAASQPESGPCDCKGTFLIDRAVSKP